MTPTGPSGLVMAAAVAALLAGVLLWCLSSPPEVSAAPLPRMVTLPAAPQPGPFESPHADSRIRTAQSGGPIP